MRVDETPDTEGGFEGGATIRTKKRSGHPFVHSGGGRCYSPAGKAAS
jgi:hypothetical protein